MNMNKQIFSLLLYSILCTGILPSCSDITGPGEEPGEGNPEDSVLPDGDYTKPYIVSSGSEVEYTRFSCTVNGRPFIPMGIYGVSKENIASAAGYGFNLVQDYGFMKWDTAEQSAYLDEAEANGVMVFVTLDGTDTSEGQYDRIVTTVERFRKHPALFAWYLADEPDKSKNITPADLERRYEAIKLIDSKHPVITSNWRIEDFKDATDMDMRQIYRGTASRCQADLKQYIEGYEKKWQDNGWGSFIDWVVILNSHDTDAPNNKEPVPWPGESGCPNWEYDGHKALDPARIFGEMQSAWNAEHPDNPTGVEDTREWMDYKAKVEKLVDNLEHPEAAGFHTGPNFPDTYESIKGVFLWALTHGSNGFFYWLFQHPESMSWRYGHYTVFQQSALRQHLASALSEIASLSIYLVNPTSADIVSFYDSMNDGKLYVWSRKVGDERIIIVVNESGEPRNDCYVNVSDLCKSGSAAVHGSDRTVDITGGLLKDSFAKDGANVYLLRNE